MSRAERRREKKAGKKRTATYNLTKPALDGMVEAEIRKEIAEARRSGYEDGANAALVLMLALPMEVLKAHYWRKSFRRRVPGFIGRVLDLYRDWQDGRLDLDALADGLWEDGGVRLVETGAGEAGRT
ncbi:MAG: hypothetical protein IJS41_03900 [Clostridia bacterium]|nr:hypothetical protein [Clostridia bacterium]